MQDLVSKTLDNAASVTDIGFRLAGAVFEDLVRGKREGLLFRFRLDDSQGVRVPAVGATLRVGLGNDTGDCVGDA